MLRSGECISARAVAASGGNISSVERAEREEVEGMRVRGKEEGDGGVERR